MDKNTFLDALLAGKDEEVAIAEAESAKTSYEHPFFQNVGKTPIRGVADRNAYLESLMRGEPHEVAYTKSMEAMSQHLAAQPYFGEQPATAGADPQSIPAGLSTPPYIPPETRQAWSAFDQPENMSDKVGFTQALKQEWLSEEGLKKLGIMSAAIPGVGIAGPLGVMNVTIQENKQILDAWERLKNPEYDYSKPDYEWVGSSLGAFAKRQRTREEDQMMVANYIAAEAEKANREYTGWGELAANVSQSLPFMFQFVSTGGLSNITSGAARGVIDGAMKKLPPALAKGLSGTAGFAGEAAGRMAGFAPNVAGNVAESITRQETGQEKEKSLGRTVYQEAGDTGAEVVSEMAGGPFGKLLGKLPFASKVSALYRKIMDTPVGKFAQKGGMHGLPGEYLEEPTGTAMRSVLGTRDEDSDQPMMERIRNGIKQDIQQFVPTVSALFAQQVLTGGVGLAVEAVRRQRFRNGMAEHAKVDLKMDEPTAQKFADAAVQVAENPQDPKAVEAMENVVQEDVKAKYEAAVEKIKPQPKPKVEKPAEGKPADQKVMEGELARLRSEIGPQLAGETAVRQPTIDYDKDTIQEAWSKLEDAGADIDWNARPEKIRQLNEERAGLKGQKGPEITRRRKEIDDEIQRLKDEDARDYDAVTVVWENESERIIERAKQEAIKAGLSEEGADVVSENVIVALSESSGREQFWGNTIRDVIQAEIDEIRKTQEPAGTPTIAQEPSKAQTPPTVPPEDDRPFYQKEAWAGPDRTQPVQPEQQWREKPRPADDEDLDIGTALDRFDSGEGNLTVQDLVNIAEQSEMDSPVIEEAVKKFRREQADDYELSGRNDMESAEDEFLSVLRGQIRTPVEDEDEAWNKSHERFVQAMQRFKGQTTPEAKLWAALHNTQGAEDRFDTYRERGATDEEIKELLSYEFGIDGGSSGYGGYRHKGGKNPTLFADMAGEGSKKVLYTGKKLINEARRLLDIPQPKGTPDAVQEQKQEEVPAQEALPKGTEPVVHPQAESQVATPKEPWQMTHDEYLKSLGMDERFIPPQPKREAARIIRVSDDETRTVGAHEKAVWDAIQEGKPVPPEVLAEYPELKPESKDLKPTDIVGVSKDNTKPIVLANGELGYRFRIWHANGHQSLVGATTEEEAIRKVEAGIQAEETEPLDTGSVEKVESTPEASHETKPDQKSAGTASESGISGPSPGSNTQGRNPPATSDTEHGGLERPGQDTDQDVHGTQSPVGDRVQGGGVSGGTVEVAGQQATGNTGGGVRGDRDFGVVPETSGNDDTADRSSVDEGNYDLRNAEPIRLTKGQRKQLNDQAKVLLDRGGPYTPEEKNTLRQYTGEGGLSSGTKEALNQHYTDYDTIKAIYDAIDASGFKYKRALEPAGGSGNFVGMRPGKQWTTVDIDETNHRVLKALYPNAKHYNISYEEFIDTGYDLVISNVPFLEIRGKGSLKNRPDIKALHDFYFVHSLDRVKDNGLIVFVTSSGTMDKLDSTIRKEIAARADILAAFRLPQGHFAANAHTEVTTDIIIMQKRPDGVETRQGTIQQQFVESVKTRDGIALSRYYEAHPEHVLGTMTVGKNKLYGGRPAYVVEGPANLGEIGFQYKAYDAPSVQDKEIGEAPTSVVDFVQWAERNKVKYRIRGDDPRFKENILIEDGKVYVTDREVDFCDVKKTAKIYRPIEGEMADKISKLDQLTRLAAEYQKTGELYIPKRAEEIVNEYRKKYLHPSKDKALRKLMEDLGEKTYYLELSSMFDTKFQMADVFKTQVRHEGSGKAKVGKKDSLRDRAFASEDTHGEFTITADSLVNLSELPALLDLGYALVRLGKDQAEVQNDILYYSGNIYDKTDTAKGLLESNTQIDDPRVTKAVQRQLAKLEEIKPQAKGMEEIHFKGNEKWIYDILHEIGFNLWYKNTNDKGMTEWEVNPLGRGKDGQPLSTKIFKRYLNNSALVNRRKDTVSGIDILEPMSEYMQRYDEAQEQVEEILLLVRDWIKRNGLASRIEEEYNRRYRNYVKPNYSEAQYLIQDVLDEIKEKSPIGLRRNQVAWVVQAVYEGRGINAHDVGGGKTYAAITLARVLKRRGIAKKPIFVVPAKTIKKWERDIKRLFPEAKIVSLGNLDATHRTKALFDLSNTNADYVLVSHEGYAQIKLPVEAELRYVEAVVREGIDDPDLSGREKGKREELIEKYMEALRRENRDTRLTFDKLGIDMVVADEAHNYKNIGVRNELVRFKLGTAFGVKGKEVETGRVRRNSAGDEVAETDTEVSMKSDRSYDFRFKANYVAEKNNQKNIFLLTATPTPNKPIEIYTMLRHLSPTIFHEYGIYNDKDFADVFFRLGTVHDRAKDRPAPVLAAIINAQDLRGILNRYVDKIPMEQMPWIKIPKEARIDHFLKRCPEYADIIEDLKTRKDNMPRKPQPGDDTPISLYTGARNASIDPRLYGGTHAGIRVTTRSMDSESDKLEFTVDAVAEVFKKNPNAGQLIFVDNAGHTQVEKGILEDDIHAEIKSELVKRGFKPTQIAIINGEVVTDPKTGKDTSPGNKKDDRKQEIADAYNAGNIKVVIGTTTSMGEGMDLQIKTTDIYHMDIPYTPGAFRQRNGRGIRYGNENEEVGIHYMFMRGTFDLLSFNIVINKKGWNEAIWEKEVADVISTEEEMTEGTIPRAEQIAIEMEEDPVQKRILTLDFQRKRMAEERTAFDQMSRRASRIVNSIKERNRENRDTLKHRQDTLAALKPKETIEDPAERQSHFERTKAYHAHLIEVSKRRIAEGEMALAEAEKKREHFAGEAVEANRKYLEFTRRYVDPVTGDIRLPPDDEPTTDLPSHQGGFVGYGRPPATARVSAIVQDQANLPPAVRAWLSRTKGYKLRGGRPGVLAGAFKGLYGFAKNFRYLAHLPRTADFAEIHEAFRHSQEIAKDATVWAKQKLQWALEPVAGVSAEAMARVRAVRLKLIADDMMEDIEKGVALPEGLTESDVQAMKDEADRLYETYSAVRESYDRFRQASREITDMLVAEGWLSEENAKEFYFPHKVIKYLRNEDAFWGMTRKPGEPRKGYLKQRKGGADYSTDVLERLFEHWAQVRRDVQMTRFLDTTLKTEQGKHFRRYLRDNNLTWKQGDPIPEGFRAVTVLPGRFYYKSHGVTEEMATALMAMDLNTIEGLLTTPDAGQQIRGLLAVGRKRQYIVREPIARQMQEMPTMAMVDPDSAMGQIYGAIRGFNTFIKRQILFNPLYAIPYHSTNFIGDAYRVAIALPKALATKHLVGYWKSMLQAKHGHRPELWDQAQRYGVIGAGWIGTDIPEIETLIPVVERAEISGAGKYLVHKLGNLFNTIRAPGQAREDWLRYATFAWLCEQADAGKNIERYAIKDLGVVKGLRDKHQKAAKIARDILGDYGAIGRSGVIVTDLIMPFYRWSHLNLPWLPRMIATYLRRGGIDSLFGAMLAAAAPYLAMLLWNYSDPDRRKVEQSLPYWRRFNFHLNDGTRTHYVNLPMDDFFNWLGVPENALDYQRFQRGMIDKNELIGRILVNSYKEPGLQALNSIGGVARVGIDLTGWETFPEPKDYRVGWKRRGLNIAGDIFGAPGTLVEKAVLGGMEYDENGNLKISQGMKDTLNRAWMPVRPYTVDEESVYRQLKSNTYKQSSKYGRRGDPHKGKTRKVESLRIQLEGIAEE